MSKNTKKSSGTKTTSKPAKRVAAENGAGEFDEVLKG